MAKNWTAYEAACALYGNNKDDIIEVGSRYPLLTNRVSMLNDELVLDIFKALPKVTARVLETGLKEMEMDEEEETVAEAPKKADKKPSTKAKEEEPEEDEDGEDFEDDYESMTAKDLYKLCCTRGISSQCKSRSKTALIEVLKKNDGAEPEEEPWEDDEEEEDPYAGKTARELFELCKKRKIVTKPKLSAEKYAALLKKEDAKNAEPEEDEDDEDEWEV